MSLDPMKKTIYLTCLINLSRWELVSMIVFVLPEPANLGISNCFYLLTQRRKLCILLCLLSWWEFSINYYTCLARVSDCYYFRKTLQPPLNKGVVSLKYHENYWLARNIKVFIMIKGQLVDVVQKSGCVTFGVPKTPTKNQQTYHS